MKGATTLDWLLAHGQSKKTVERFWHPVLVSALNEDLDRASLRYAAKVFLEAFLSHPKGWWLGIPAVPLSVLYGESVSQLMENHNGRIVAQCSAERLVAREGRIVAAQLASGESLKADFVILALPWRAAAEFLPGELMAAASGVAFKALTPSPITGVHLWFDRPVTDLEFAALPGNQVQWIFNKSLLFDSGAAPGTYLQLVTSASRAWMELTKSQILEIALGELQSVLPEVRNARVLKSYVLKEPAATFSPSAENEALRPSTETRICNLFLAGDWIRTGWPATMEGAVRGGYLAAEAVLRATGAERKLLVPDLPATGLMRFLKGQRGKGAEGV
jgi:zeta-carotene desaturase